MAGGRASLTTLIGGGVRGLPRCAVRELDAVQARVRAVRREQLGVRPDLDDAPAVEHDDAVGVLDRRQPVRDHDRGASAHQRIERGLHLALRFRVERRGRLVEDQQRRVLEERARDGDALALAARQAHAVLADHRVEAFAASRG